MLDLAHLRRVAVKAVPNGGSNTVAPYITCNPATILALLDRLEAAERVVELVREENRLWNIIRDTGDDASTDRAETISDDIDAAIATHAALTWEAGE